MKEEESLHIAVCDYIKYQYPKVLFNTDLSGIKLTKGQAVKVKKMRNSRGWPDIFIAEPRKNCHGLFIELKKEGTKLYKKDGITPISDHIAEQIIMLHDLYLRGYYADFACGFYEAKKLIDNYLTL